MSYNPKYNTRNSGRYNTPGQFVPGGELAPARPAPRNQPIAPPQQHQQTFGINPQAPQQQVQQQHKPLQPPQQQRNQNLQLIQPQDVEMSAPEAAGDAEGANGRPPWMKSKLPGVKKISNKERRRRQNATLRKLITPKNALMVLNEMMPNEQITNQFKVEPATQYAHQYMHSKPGQHAFCADLTVDGKLYKGYGDNKLTARNSAAEQAIADLIIKKMNKVMQPAEGGAPAAEAPAEEGAPEEEALPMIQLASFALHKLFSEWENEGYKVPHLKPGPSASESEMDSTPSLPPGPRPKPRAKPRALPVNAAAMHPCMLLTYMRPALDYRELAAEGDKPQTMVFTMGVDVDGATYIGKASNKKEARKQAAKSACQALFKVTFDDTPTANTPVAPTDN